MHRPAGTPFVRPAHAGDLDALLALARQTGGGMTNLPPDRDDLAHRIARSEAALAADIAAPQNEYYLLVLDDGQGTVVGTASLFSRIGAVWPFYSYKIARVSHVSRDLDRVFATQVLHLVNDFDGASEVGGLFLSPASRTGGLGALLARSRYLFIALHRARFGERVVAELRGYVDESGNSPFWDAVAGPFFGCGFHEADLHNALHGNQFIGDLMPRYPIYTTMLPEPARAAICRPHPNSAPAQRLLEAEGFVNDGYCDPFDAGPTLWARTNAIRTIRDSVPVGDKSAPALACRAGRALMARGTLGDFRAWLTDDKEPLA